MLEAHIRQERDERALRRTVTARRIIQFMLSYRGISNITANTCPLCPAQLDRLYFDSDP